MAESKSNEDEEKKVKVTIQYCPGCGYAAKFNIAKVLLEDRFPDQLEIIGKKDADKTENFEISVNGTLVHSKKTKNQGFLTTDNAEAEQIICQAIMDACK